MRNLRTLLIGADTPGPAARAAWLLAAAGAAYLTYAGATYLDLKSGLPAVLCGVGGLVLAAPVLLVVTRPLLAWRVAWLSAVVTGLAVQSHGRTPFSWHPAVLGAQLMILFVLALRLPLAVSAWAGASMALLIAISFYPADRVPLTAITAVVMGVAVLIRQVRLRPASRRGSDPGLTDVRLGAGR
ncbi:MAG: hypothetical protein ABW022_18320 [Actinoplanes sp.]